MELHRKTKAGRYGTHPVFFTIGPIGGTNNIGGASPLTANATTIFRVPTGFRKLAFLRFTAHATTIPVDADGTILATCKKWDATASAEVTLSTALDLEALVTKVGSKVDAVSTATPAQLTINNGDVLDISVVNNSAAIDTQPATLYFVVECAVLE